MGEGKQSSSRTHLQGLVVNAVFNVKDLSTMEEKLYNRMPRLERGSRLMASCGDALKALGPFAVRRW